MVGCSLERRSIAKQLEERLEPAPLALVPFQYTIDHRLLAIGETIRTERQSRGIAQDVLARNALLDKATLGRIERGESNVGVLKLTQIATVFGVTTGELLTKAGV